MTPIERARAHRAELKASGVPQRNKTWVERYAARPTNLRLAIACMCMQCMGGESASGAREQVRGCTSTACPLHPHRPYQFRRTKETT